MLCLLAQSTFNIPSSSCAPHARISVLDSDIDMMDGAVEMPRGAIPPYTLGPMPIFLGIIK